MVVGYGEIMGGGGGGCGVVVKGEVDEVEFGIEVKVCVVVLV